MLIQSQLVSSDNSLRLYNLISSTLALPNLDDFYHLSYPSVTNLVNSSSHNVLLAFVDWVETDNAPNELIGSAPGTGAQRVHCRYPQKTIFNGKSFECQI
ncbi:hypothetical protein K439DRAFT_1637874 [Ramaria rubella]|nr:hypothetical protein K439DRAFT_1637874 [Ramaria rubella]